MTPRYQPTTVGNNLDHDADVIKVESCPTCGCVTDIDYADQCPECRCAPGRAHAEGCPVFDEVRYPDEWVELPAISAEEQRLWEAAGSPCRRVFGYSCGLADKPSFAECCTCTWVPSDGFRLDKNPLHRHMRETFAACLAISKAKNAGYAGDAEPLANFRTAESLGVPVALGIAVRMSDKWARLTRLLQTGENPLPSESITDTLQDLINYAAILLYALETERETREATG